MTKDIDFSMDLVYLNSDERRAIASSHIEQEFMGTKQKNITRFISGMLGNTIYEEYDEDIPVKINKIKKIVI